MADEDRQRYEREKRAYEQILAASVAAAQKSAKDGSPSSGTRPGKRARLGSMGPSSHQNGATQARREGLLTAVSGLAPV